MFSQTVEYALRAMVCLAQLPDQRTASSALANETHVPPDYLAKVLQQLASAGLIEGRRGVGGGYRLRTTPDKVNLLDVVNAVEPIKRITSCPLHIQGHGTKLCQLHLRLDAAIEGVIKSLESSSLADLIAGEAGAKHPLCKTSQQVDLSINSQKP